jgi:hypothetical protein
MWGQAGNWHMIADRQSISEIQHQIIILSIIYGTVGYRQEQQQQQREHNRHTLSNTWVRAQDNM